MFAIRAGSRAIPGVGAALLLYDLYELYKGYNPQPPGFDMRGWNKQWGPYTYTGQNGSATKDSFFRPYIDRSLPEFGPLSRQGYQGPINIANVDAASLVEVYDYTAIQSNKLRYISGWKQPVAAALVDPDVALPAMPTTHPMPGTPRVRGGYVNPSPRTPTIPRWVDPLSYPPGTAVPEPMAPPYRAIPERVPNPYRSPSEQTHIGPAPRSPINVGVPTAPTPAVPPRIVIGQPTPGGSPGTRPGQPGTGSNPGTGTGTNPGTPPNPSPSTRPENQPAKREPPGKNEKERKAKIKRNGIVQGIAKVAGVATETLDFINVMYDALPKSCKPGYYQLTGKGGKKFWKRRWRANQTQRIKAIASCWDHADVTKLVTGFISNHFEDKVIGKVGQKAKQAHEASGSLRPLGLQSGPWDTMSGKAWQEYQRKEEKRKEWLREYEREEIAARKAIIKAQRSAANKAAYRNRFTKDGRP